jgi:uncharacterized protein YcfL
MKNYLLLAISLFTVAACSGAKYNPSQDKDVHTSCFEVEHEMDKLKNKDSKKATARYNALKTLHKKKNCE